MADTGFQRRTWPDDPLRLFVAVPMPHAVAVYLEQIQRRFQARKLNLRWVKTRNIHLTLKFLGDTAPARVPGIAAAMDAAAASVETFRLRAEGVGVFPHLRNARVVWVGLTGEVDRLNTLRETLESVLESIGVGRDVRGYRAHLTIGRIRRRVDARLLGAELERHGESECESFRVDRLGLFESVLKPAGAEYALLHASPLGG